MGYCQVIYRNSFDISQGVFAAQVRQPVARHEAQAQARHEAQAQARREVRREVRREARREVRHSRGTRYEANKKEPPSEGC